MKRPMLLVAIALSMHVVVSQTANGGDVPLLPARFTPAKPQEPKEGSLMVLFCGTVTEVNKESITIHWPGEEKPKKFSVSETLSSGGFPTKSRSGIVLAGHLIRSSFCYRLTDVKVGDHVEIRFACLDGVDICDQICINKRPGGKVPPLPEGVENLKPPIPAHLLQPGEVYPNMIPYHERMNALWDLEDKGIPYPEKFGPYRRFPVAPMPREAGVSGRLISQ